MHSPQSAWLDYLRSASHYNQWIFSQIQPHLKGKVLEIGCGGGNFTELIAQGCPQLVAIDINPDFVAQTKARLKYCSNTTVLAADATTLEWSQSFDAIILLDVLEHIADDVALLQRLSQWLTPNGVLILKTPAIQQLYNRLDKAVGHHRRYTQETLQQALTDAAFVNSRIWPFNLAGIPGWWLNGAVLGKKVPSRQQVGWFDSCVPMFRAMESKLGCPIGLSLFAVGYSPHSRFPKSL
ncbi:MAG: class I SAM-dependent methyltransferase [Leptolyngbyaceae cyanobacterium MO_188.B28]|nr:class I SAM-dependent methyltransferase [Leptolyngbyaceae cyanobacterium MO_188.B28]